MRILVLCEGDAETLESWSGSSKSVVDGLRDGGHTVVCRDIDLYGFVRALALALTFSPRRRRWWVNYHLGAVPFRLRSRRARQHIAALTEPVDVILQIGGTFVPPEVVNVPIVLYCDSNILLASHAANPTGADLQSLTLPEIEDVRAREQRVYESASAILTMSERLRRSFIDDFGVSGEKVETIYAGANLDIEQIPIRSESESDSAPTILFVGKDFERKGGPFLLSVFEKVRDRIPDARLLIVGPPALALDTPGVECLGFLNKASDDGWQRLVEAYAGADIFCMPTKFEPFGIAFVEAMLFGVPCVGPNAWAVPEIISHGETGYVADTDDAEDFANRLIELIEDPTKARSMGSTGRERALALFTWEATIARMVRALEQLRARS